MLNSFYEFNMRTHESRCFRVELKVAPLKVIPSLRGHGMQTVKDGQEEVMLIFGGINRQNMLIHVIYAVRDTKRAIPRLTEVASYPPFKEAPQDKVLWNPSSMESHHSNEIVPSQSISSTRLPSPRAVPVSPTETNYAPHPTTTSAATYAGPLSAATGQHPVPAAIQQPVPSTSPIRKLSRPVRQREPSDSFTSSHISSKIYDDLDDASSQHKQDKSHLEKELLRLHRIIADREAFIKDLVDDKNKVHPNAAADTTFEERERALREREQNLAKKELCVLDRERQVKDRELKIEDERMRFKQSLSSLATIIDDLHERKSMLSAEWSNAS